MGKAPTNTLPEAPRAPADAPGLPGSHTTRVSGQAVEHMSARLHAHVLFWLLPLALIEGLLFLALVPPWQHYDEPNHFEYVRLVALTGRRPTPDEYDLETGRAIIRSMYEFRFWHAGAIPNLFQPQSSDLGFDQRVHPPFYYAVAALPVRLLLHTSIETQLYAARGVSLVLFILTILVAWRIGQVAFPDEPIYALAVPLLVMLVPAFSDIMTAVNNDVLANFALAVTFLASIYLVRNGLQPTIVLMLGLAMFVALMSKRTALIGAILPAVALLWAVVRRPLPWWLWVGTILGVGTLAGTAAFTYDSYSDAQGVHHLLRARPWLVALDEVYLRFYVDATIQSISDLQRSGWVYPILMPRIFFSFWQRMAWGHVTVPPLWDLATLGICVLAIIGLVVAMVRENAVLPLWQRRTIWMCVLAALVAWAATILRIHPVPAYQMAWHWPVGRYMHIVFVPVILLVVYGWSSLFPRPRRPVSVVVLISYFFLLHTTVWAVILADSYYR